ncbi:MAG: histidine kinase dimerization/phosphoacceptor domain -containing protein, partial [Flavobacteriales bacterium]
QVIEVFGVGHEITEQKDAQETVRNQAARLQAIFDSSANTMIWTLDQDLRITSCNAHFRETIFSDFGLERNIGDLLFAEYAEKAGGANNERNMERYRAAIKGKPQQFEVELVNQYGKTIWVENFLNPILVEGQVQEISCLAYTITDRKEAQNELLSNLHEKEVLLKEVHHRVKNNLQIVSSIFSLQTAHVGEDKRILDLLRDSRDRIRSMSFIHESLYQNKDFSSIDLADYMEGLSRNLMMSYSLTGKVRLETDLQRVDLALDQAIPCGLILNELISNALKHAFPEGREGTIHMGLQLVDNKVSISLRDDGLGTPPGFDPQRDANLGLELVHTLVEQLDGHLTMKTDGGVAYLLTFERIK